MSKFKYHLVISGDAPSRKAVIASVLFADTRQDISVIRGQHKETIPFIFRGDARIVLRKAARELLGGKPERPDGFRYKDAAVSIVKM